MLDLTKSASLDRSVTSVMVGLGWDVSGGGKKGLMGAINRAKGVDLDASAVAFDSNRQAIGCCWYDNMRPFGGALTHTGDNRTGKGDGYDETILADLTRMPAEVQKIVFTLSSYKGASFAKVSNATCGLVDTSNGAENVIGEIYLPVQGNNTAALVLKVERDGRGGWTAQKLSKLDYGKTWQDLARIAQNV